MSIEELYKLYLNSTGVSTDTRNIQSGNIFFALTGPTFNGNQYATKAINMGATHVVVDDAKYIINKNYILVPNVLSCLQELAHYHRKVLAIPVIAICGSNGKTTTKELVYNVLSTQYNVFATPGNFNNHIGVPLSLLSITKDITHAVIEIGANHLNETAVLCKIAEPDYGVITNNGYDHLEGYGSIEVVSKANGELYDYLATTIGMAFVNADDNELMTMSNNLKRITYGTNGDVKGNIINNYPFLTLTWGDKKELEVETHLAGDYNVPNILCATAVGKYFGISNENIIKGISSYYPKNNRSQLIERDTNKFIVDCYNANPSSMEAALKYFNSIPVNNKIVILGDMFELGDMSDMLHSQILTLVHSFNFNLVMLVGHHFTKANEQSKYNYLSFKSTNEAAIWFNSQTFTDTIFLLKASRGIALEKLL